jgi:hypothetical protein
MNGIRDMTVLGSCTLIPKAPWIPYMEFRDSRHAIVNAINFSIFLNFLRV